VPGATGFCRVVLGPPSEHRANAVINTRSL
jgi:hypothetical protein